MSYCVNILFIFIIWIFITLASFNELYYYSVATQMEPIQLNMDVPITEQIPITDVTTVKKTQPESTIVGVASTPKHMTILKSTNNDKNESV